MAPSPEGCARRSSFVRATADRGTAAAIGFFAHVLDRPFRALGKSRNAAGQGQLIRHLGSGWGGEDAGEEVAVIGARLGPYPVVAPDRVGPGAQSAEPKDDLAPERPRHCEAGMGIADRAVALDPEPAAREVAADEARRGGAGPLVHRLGID